MKKAPGPSFLKLFANLNQIRKDPLSFGNQLIEEYGDVVSFRVGFMNIIAFNRPEDHEYVLKTNYNNFTKGKGYGKLAPLIGQGLLVINNGPRWKQNRRIIGPVMSPKKMDKYFEDIVDSCDQLFDQWRNSYKEDNSIIVPFHKDMVKFAIAAISRSIFNADYSEDAHEVSDAIEVVMRGFEDKILQVIPYSEHIPTEKNLNYKRSLKFLNGKMDEIIKERRNNYSEGDDLISRLIRAQAEDDAQGITDDYLKDEIMTFFVGGHDTSSNGIVWTLFLIDQNPDVKEKLQKICDDIEFENLNFKDIDKIEYLDLVVNEGLRYYPPVWITSREAIEKDNIGGYEVEKDTIIVISNYFLHNHKKIWGDPENFRPERFLSENLTKEQKSAYIPFGLGPRRCIGEYFAKTEIKTFIIKFMKNFNYSTVDPENVKPHASITLRPKNGINFKLTQR